MEEMLELELVEENASLKSLLAKVNDLAVLPHVVFKVLELSGSTDNPASEIERAITVDPGFSSKVLILADDAYTCGILHNIGKTLLDRLGDTEYKHVEDMVAFGIKDYKAEEAVYGCNHMQIAVAAAKKWGLAESLVSGLDYIHAAEED